MFHFDFEKHKHFGPGSRGGGPFGGGPFGGPGPFRRGGPFGEGGPGRHKRGDIRFILLALIREQPRHGYEIIKELEHRNSGFYRPSPGSIYPTLQMLEEEGSLTSEMVDGKRVYTITDAGREILEAQEQARGEGWHGGRRPGFNMPSPELEEMRRTSMSIFESMMQAARYGTPEQLEAIQAILTKANQDIHAILAKDNGAKI